MSVDMPLAFLPTGSSHELFPSRQVLSKNPCYSSCPLSPLSPKTTSLLLLGIPAHRV